MQIGTFAFNKSSHSRTKTLVAAMAAALAFAVSVQAAAPTPATALPNADQCMRWWNLIVYAEDHGNWGDADFYQQRFTDGNCIGAVSGV